MSSLVGHHRELSAGGALSLQCLLLPVGWGSVWGFEEWPGQDTVCRSLGNPLCPAPKGDHKEHARMS